MPDLRRRPRNLIRRASLGRGLRLTLPPMRTHTLTRSANVLHRAEVERWEAAWRDFWNAVDAAEPAAADAYQGFFSTLSDDDLKALARGETPPAWVATQAASDAAFKRWEAEWGESTDPVWSEWWKRTGERLPATQGPGHVAQSPRDLSVWPHTVPLPEPSAAEAKDAERLRAHLAERLRAHLAEASPGSPEELCAALCLLNLATVRVLRGLPAHA